MTEFTNCVLTEFGNWVICVWMNTKTRGRRPTSGVSKIPVSVRCLPQNKEPIMAIAKMDGVFHLMVPASDFYKPEQTEFEKLKRQAYLSACEAEDRRRDLEELQKKLDRVVMEGVPESVSVAYWHDRAIKAEKRAAELENQISGNVG